MVGDIRHNDHQLQRTAKEMLCSSMKRGLRWLQASPGFTNMQAVAMQRSCLLFDRTARRELKEGHAR